ncbi:MAG: YraN family protein [Candidatus Limnocylindrales bacterium]
MSTTQRLPSDAIDRRSARRRLGDRAESVVATQLAALGWTVVAASVQVGRDEIDLICVEPSLPPTLVFVEVRSHTTETFGAPEESVDAAKVARIYRAAMTLLRAQRLPDGRRLPQLHWRVDLVAVDGRRADGDEFAQVGSRHIRGITPG